MNKITLFLIFFLFLQANATRLNWSRDTILVKHLIGQTDTIGRSKIGVLICDSSNINRISNDTLITKLLRVYDSIESVKIDLRTEKDSNVFENVGLSFYNASGEKILRLNDDGELKIGKPADNFGYYKLSVAGGIKIDDSLIVNRASGAIFTNTCHAYGGYTGNGALFNDTNNITQIQLVSYVTEPTLTGIGTSLSFGLHPAPYTFGAIGNLSALSYPYVYPSGANDSTLTILTYNTNGVLIQGDTVNIVGNAFFRNGIVSDSGVKAQLGDFTVSKSASDSVIDGFTQNAVIDSGIISNLITDSINNNNYISTDYLYSTGGEFQNCYTVNDTAVNSYIGNLTAINNSTTTGITNTGTIKTDSIYNASRSSFIGNMGIGASAPLNTQTYFPELLIKDTINAGITIMQPDTALTESRIAQIMFVNGNPYFTNATKAWQLGILGSPADKQSDMFWQYFNGSTFLEAMRLKSGGNLGIGTSTPAYKLDVNGQIKANDNIQVINSLIPRFGMQCTKITNDGYGIFYFGGASGVGASSITFYDTATSLGTNKGDLQINTSSAGGDITLGAFYNEKIGIGTNAPSNKLSVHSATGTNTIQMTNPTTGTTATDGTLLYNSSALDFVISNLENGHIYTRTNGNITTVHTADNKLMIPDSTNGIVLDKTNGIRTFGTASHFNDMGVFNLSESKDIGATGAPALTATGRGFSLPAFNIGDSLQGSVEHDHQFMEGDTSFFHIHYLTNGTEGSIKYVNWSIHYVVFNPNDTATYNTTITYQDTIPANTPSLTHRIKQFTPVSMPLVKIGSYFFVVIKRIASTSEPAANPFGMAVGVHKRVNSLGSRQIFIK